MEQMITKLISRTLLFHLFWRPERFEYSIFYKYVIVNGIEKKLKEFTKFGDFIQGLYRAEYLPCTELVVAIDIPKNLTFSEICKLIWIPASGTAQQGYEMAMANLKPKQTIYTGESIYIHQDSSLKRQTPSSVATLSLGGRVSFFICLDLPPNIHLHQQL